MAELLQQSELEFTSMPDNINLVESFVQNLKAELGFGDEMEANILVSLSEAVNNAIFHGNKLDPGKKVCLSLHKQLGSLQFAVSDEGPGFDYNRVEDPTAAENIDKPTGRGIYLMRALADKVEFADGGKKVLLTFLQG